MRRRDVELENQQERKRPREERDRRCCKEINYQHEDAQHEDTKRNPNRQKRNPNLGNGGMKIQDGGLERVRRRAA